MAKSGRKPKQYAYENLTATDADWVREQMESSDDECIGQGIVVPDVLLPFMPSHFAEGSDSSRIDYLADPISFWSVVDIGNLVAFLHKCNESMTAKHRHFLMTVHLHAQELDEHLSSLWPEVVRNGWQHMDRKHNQAVIDNIATVLQLSHLPARDLPFAVTLNRTSKPNLRVRKNLDSVPYSAMALMAFFGPMKRVLLRSDIDFKTWREIVSHITGVEIGSLRRFNRNDLSVLNEAKMIYEDILADIKSQLGD